MTPKTSLGFACIDFAHDVLLISLLPWQKWLLIHALELLPDGTFRFRTIVLLVARQNGKSTLMQVLSLFLMYVRGAPLVIGTAQNLDVAEEQWEGAVELAEGNPELADEIAQVVRVNGKKSLRLRTKERYKVATASRRGGRGLSGDLILLDELREHQNWDAWAAVTKTTMARRFAQIWAASNAGDVTSVVLAHLRRLAHLVLGNPDGLPADDVELPDEASGVEADDLGIFEWSAPPDCSIWDRDAWAQANPSLGHTIEERAIASAARTDPESVFRTEVLCQWVEQMDRVIPATEWAASLDETYQRLDDVEYAVDVDENADGVEWCTVGVSDGVLAEVAHSAPGVEWVVSNLTERGITEVTLHPASPAGKLVDPLEKAGITVHKLKASEFAQACQQFVDAVTAGGVKRRVQQGSLNRAAVSVVKKDVDDGGFRFSRVESPVDISPLNAVTMARYAVLTTKPTPRPGFLSLGDFIDDEE